MPVPSRVTLCASRPEPVVRPYARWPRDRAFAVARHRSDDLKTFLESALASADTPFVGTASRVLDAEFPPKLEARRVLSAIGYGERARKRISDAVGVEPGNLSASLDLLIDEKRVVRVSYPYATRSLNAPSYSIADPYLRFWLRFVERELPAIERQRVDEVVARILDQWSAVRGKMVEPIIRDALERLLPDDRLPGASHIGSYWNRKGDLEVDLVGGDHERKPQEVVFVGSIKWRERVPFGSGDTKELIEHAERVPGVGPSTLLVAVSRSGIDRSARKIDLSFSPRDLVS